MNDEQLDDLLRCVRPAGPPSDLRARIFAPRRAPRAWPWAMAAAALLMLTVTVHFSATRMHREIARVVASAQEDSVDLLELRAALNDNELLIQQAESWTAEEQRQALRAGAQTR